MTRFLQRASLLLFTLLLPLGGCGFYTFSGAVPGHLNTVAVPPFENQTAEFGLAQDITRELIDAFDRDGSLKVRELRSADSAVRGVVQRINDRPSTVTADEAVQEYRVTIVAKVVYEDLVKQKVVFEESISTFGIYPYSGGSQAERSEGLEEAVNKLVEEILNKTVSGW